MPCDQIRTMRVAVTQIVDNTFDIGKVDGALLHDALLSLNVPERATTYDGKTLTIRTSGGPLPITLDQIKVAYSTKVVEKTAKKFGWQVKTQACTQDGVQTVYRKR